MLERRTVGLVPTMGALHAGHLSLARQAALECHEVFFSIYVNPTQFGVHEDFGSYPRTWDSDLAQLEGLNTELLSNPEKYKGYVTAVFAPTTRAMYPTLPPSSEINADGTFVTIKPLGTLLEGASRPVFFRGVATVCAKLFNIVRAERVYFGQKDIQQTAIIKRLITDLHMDAEVRIIPTEREPDGLAMSSRNVYLGERRRRVAVTLPTALRIAETQYLAAEATERARILGPALEHIAEAIAAQDGLPNAQRVNMELDYLSLADPESMEEVDVVDENRGAVLSAALKMLPLEDPQSGEDLSESGGASRAVRLIDNIILPPRAIVTMGMADDEEARIEKLVEVVEEKAP